MTGAISNVLIQRELDMTESEVNIMKFQRHLLSYFERPGRDHILLYNFRMMVSGYFPKLMPFRWWKSVINEVDKKNRIPDYHAKYCLRMHKLATRAFIEMGCIQYELSSRNFIDAVFRTLNPDQIKEMDEALIAELEDQQKYFIPEDVYPPKEFA